MCGLLRPKQDFPISFEGSHAPELPRVAIKGCRREIAIMGRGAAVFLLEKLDERFLFGVEFAPLRSRNEFQPVVHVLAMTIVNGLS